MDFNSAPLTMILIALNVVFSLIGFTNETFRSKCVLWPYGMKRNNEYYRFLSSGFIHADWIHLLFNMFSFFFFGTTIERYFKTYELGSNFAYLLLYFAALVVADLRSYFRYQDDRGYTALGASGAVSAVIFACVLFDPWGIIRLYFIPMPFLVFAFVYLGYCIYMSKKDMDNVNHDAHLWGAVFGLAFSFVLIALKAPDMIPTILEELMNPHFGR